MTPTATKQTLYLSYDGLTDPLGQSQILPYLCGLSAEGFSITIVSFEKPERFNKGYAAVKALCDKHNLSWRPLVYHKNPPVVSTVFDLIRLRMEVVKLHRQNKFLLVHCRSYITALVGLWMKQRYGVKFIFDMRGFWADERIEGGLWNLRNPLFRGMYRFFKEKEKRFIRHADRVIALTEAAREEIVSWKLTDRITVIPCCVDMDLFDPGKVQATPTQDLRSKLGIGHNDFVLLYLGSLGTWYLLDEMMLFFKKLKTHVPHAKFLFLTPDSNKVTADKDVIVSTVARHEVPAYISISNASICFIKPSFSKKGSSATKMAEVMAMGIPVITNAGWGDVAFMNSRLEGLLVVQPGSEDAVIQQLMNTTPKKPSPYFQQFFSLAGGIARYSSVYNDLTHNL